MTKTKSEIIEAVNNIKNIKIADLKNSPVKNSSGTNHRALLQYNAMLDNITLGAHTTTTIDFAGLDWTFRLLTAQEYIDIRLSVIEGAKKEQVFDDFYTWYLTILKTLTKALSPSPFKSEGTTVFSEDDLKMVNFDILEELYRRYIDFIQQATKIYPEFTNEEIEELIAVVKKKPEVLTAYDRSRLLITSQYLLNYCVNLEKITRDE